MSDMCTDGRQRRRLRGVSLQTLLCWTFIGLCFAGHRPRERGERTRHARHQDRWTQRIRLPSIHDQGTQRIQFPSIHDQGAQRIQFPSIHDQGTQRIQFPSIHDQGTQRIQFPSIHDQGTQRIEYPTLNDEGQTVNDPSVNDSDASAQIQTCAPGYYRDSSGSFLGRCVSCKCDDLADECEDRTGRCLNCRFNTAGDRCERCKEGYYGNAALRTCKVCPCPSSSAANSFAIGCKEVFGDVVCICRAGYSGDKCESCAPGYYGDPLSLGGSCRPCKCNGNSNNCDRRTGVCKNTLEPGDTNSDDHCQECDNCAQTLLHDMEKLDEDLGRIKTLLDNATASASSQDRLKQLAKATSDTKALVEKFSSAINTEKSRVNQLEEDVSTLTDDIGTLKEKADKRAADADKAVGDVEKTQRRARNLDSEIQNTLKKIQALLDQLNEAGTSGETLPNENLAKMLADAQRMVKEMEERNFTPQKTAAEKERDEAKKLLDYIKSDVTKQGEQNEAAAEKLRGLLKDYQDKLKDLDAALKEAVELLGKANTQNGLNAQTLADLQKRIEDLRKERKVVEDQVTMAEDELQKTEGLVKTLSDSKTEYEQLAAQMDGAKTDLTKKVNDITRAAAQEGLVEDAEEHAKNLAKLAKELEDAVKNASGRTEVRNAKDAIDAYKNITDAINAAEAAANEAKQAAGDTLNNVKNQALTQKAKDLKDTSNDLLKNANEAEADLEGSADDINDLKRRLTNANKKKTALQKDLLDVQNDLNDIQRDDIEAILNEAKQKSASANDSAADTMNRLNAIKAEMDKINVTPVDSNLNNVLNDVDKSVKNLLNTIPSLDDKIAEVEDLTSQFSPGNITDNINKIKELIEQARDAANRIVIPMKFVGNGHVELRTPKNLEDLKAYTALSLTLQRPKGRGDGRRRRRQTANTEDMFVLYLGNRDTSKNYIGMVLKRNVLYGVYKLNGVEYTMETGAITTSASEPAKFDRVDLRRIYQDAEIVLSQYETPVPKRDSHKGEESKNLLDLTPSDVVFYVGGYPNNFTPPASLNFPKYKGCIEFSSFNDKVISLYNFKNAENIDQTPCKRYVPPKDSDYYEGTGYSKVIIDKFSSVLIIGFTVSTHSENGLLLYIQSQDNYFAITMEKGIVFLHSDLLPEPKSNNKKTFPTANWAEILIVISNKGNIIVRMGGEEMVKTSAVFNYAFTEYYVGGAPRDLRAKHNITMQPFKGCVKNLKLNSNFKPASEQVGVSKGCPENLLVSRKAEFSLGSSLSAKLDDFSLANDVTVSLGFKTTENQGLMLQDKQLANGLNLVLENGHVILNLNSKQWKSNKQYSDGQWHYLTVTRRGERVQLLVDDEDKGQVQSGSASMADTGGSVILGKDKFKGCMTNLYTRRPTSLFKAEDLGKFQTSGEVLLDVCTADTLPQLMLDRAYKKDVGMQAMNESLSACALPALVQNAYRLGGPVSSLSYSLPLQVLQPRPHFSLDVRTRAPEGLLFFAATRGGRSHLALYLSKGRIRLSVGKQKEIFNREKYNDGKWHSVIFSLEKKKFRLVVDGIRAQDGQLTNAELTSMQQFVSPVYLGSAPDSLHKELKLKALPKQSVSGCIRNFKMNGAAMSSPTTNHGAGPCFDGPTQRGAYFSGNGAHVTINDSSVVGSSFELLFNIRPRSPTGLLLHVGDSSWNQYGPAMGHYLTVYMLRGEVVAQANNGKGEFMVSVKPKASLCDGMFHKISVIKRKNVVQLHVDTVDNYKIGPPSSTSSATKDSLYVGGVPETSLQQRLPVTSSFVGCIQDMRINGDPVSLDRLSSASGPVNLKECPG